MKLYRYVILLFLLTSCASRSGNLSNEDSFSIRSYKSKSIKPKFYKNKNKYFSLDLERVLNKSGDIVYLNIYMKNERKSLSDNAMLKILVNGNTLLHLKPYEKAKISHYDIDSGYLTEKLRYIITNDDVSSISESNDCQIILESNDVILSGSLTRMNTKAIYNFLMNSY